jgi:hypothetical protein
MIQIVSPISFSYMKGYLRSVASYKLEIDVLDIYNIKIASKKKYYHVPGEYKFLKTKTTCF